MYTRCPECHIAFRLRAEHLRAGHGEVYCNQCNVVFNALEYLGDTPEATQESLSPVNFRVPTVGAAEAVSGLHSEIRYTNSNDNHSQNKSSAGKHPPTEREHWLTRLGWMIGNGALLVLLMLQVSYLMIASYANEESLRPLLGKMCFIAHCTLPPFHDIHSLQIMERQLRPITGGRPGYVFLLVIANQASLSQSLPRIKLTLIDKKGQAAAERIFLPEEYLPPPENTALMPPGKPYEIRLQFAKTAREISGFSFALI